MKFKEMNLPNKLTTIRMFLVPVVIVLFALFILNQQGILKCDLYLFNDNKVRGNNVYNEYLTLNQLLICFFFVGASFTDYLDGHIARKNNIVSDYGKLMDPLADKLLVNSTLILMAVAEMYLSKGQNPFNLFNVFVMIMVVFSIARDFFVDALKTQALKKNVVVAATIWGKLKTATLIVGIATLILGSMNYIIYFVGLFLVLLGSTFSIIGGIDYWFELKNHIGD